MIRRTATFLLIVALIAAVASLVYLNPQPSVVKLPPAFRYELSLGAIIIASTMLGAALVFLLLLLREGRWALRRWSMNRERRHAERNCRLKTESRSLALAGQHLRARTLLTRATKRSESTLLDLLEYAESYRREGALKEARKVLENGIDDFGNDPLLLHAIGEVCYALGDYAAAAVALERALATYPASAALITLLRDVLEAAGSWQRLEEIQYRLTALKPDDEDEKHRLIRYRFSVAKHMESERREAALKSIISSAPGFAPAIILRAKLLSERGARRAALRVLEKGLKTVAHLGILEELEQQLADSGRRSRLLKVHRKLLASRPEDQALKLHIAGYALKDGRLEDAERLLSEVDPGFNPPLKLALEGELHRLRSQDRLAEQCYRKALSASLGVDLAAAEESGTHADK